MKYAYASLSMVAVVALTGAVGAHRPARRDAKAVAATLSEWTVRLSETSVPAGPVTFTVTNTGSIPHALEIEGNGTERQTPLIQPGEKAALTLTLDPGTYEVYCPVGQDSHKKLGMDTRLKVVAGGNPASTRQHAAPASGARTGGSGTMSGDYGATLPVHQAMAAPVQPIRVTGGGPVIQILPGSFPFPDSAGPILKAFGEEHEALESQMQNGPYSNNVAPITGRFTFSAWDKGAVRDSVDGVAEFTTKDGAQWKAVLDRVQTTDVPHHPKFGGVIRGLFYHGNTGVHTPLVPTINSAVALWSIAHLYRNGALVSDSAYVHVMLLSHTRRTDDYALACWDCSANRIDELQLQITPGPRQPKFDSPGGFLFVNWEGSTARPAAY